MSFFDDIKSKAASEISNGFDAAMEEAWDRDPTLATASPAEANIRNQIAFSTLRFSFPTTATNLKLSFPAYLTAFQESFSPQWQETQAFGRADPIPVYSNTARSVTLGFSIPNYDSDDANENLKKLNKLIQSLYPGYTKLSTGATVLASPPLCRIKFANLLINHTNPFRGLLGYIKSFSTDFQINAKGVFMKSHVTPGRQTIFPRVLSFNITFQPLHESPIGWNMDKAGEEFFGNADYPYRTKLSMGDVMQAPIQAASRAAGEFLEGTTDKGLAKIGILNNKDA